MSFTLEWDEGCRNLTKHGVSFPEASTFFADGLFGLK